MTDIHQEHITANQVAGRDIDNSTTINHATIINVINQPLKRLIKKFREESENGITTQENDSFLCFFQSEVDAIGLQKKLERANMGAKLQRAMASKEYFIKELNKKKFYKTGQELYATLLHKIYHGFNQNIKPLIENEEPASVIDSAESTLINNLALELGDDLDIIKPCEFDGMLYFLTGKCHIKWDKD
ncbi:MAG TPA: hypothetical protein DCP47_06930 [Phycisphaerales bacterium]|nr:hypothetical protein [Phycisphaerales bacterium]